MSVLFLALPVATQEEPGVVARVFFISPKIGHAQQFEEAIKQHIAWRRQQGETWTWWTWQIQSGERFGQYVVGTFGHQWSDFDNPPLSPQEASAHFWSTTGQHVESATSQFALFLPNLSAAPSGDGPASLSVVLTFHLNGRGSVPKFLNAVAKTGKGIQKTNWPSRGFWYVLVSGTKQPAYILALAQENWADLAPPERSYPAMLEEAYGRQEAEAILKTFDKTIKSQYSEIFLYRPDLSHIPGQ
jgi:hypothetical protein